MDIKGWKECHIGATGYRYVRCEPIETNHHPRGGEMSDMKPKVAQPVGLLASARDESIGIPSQAM